MIKAIIGFFAGLLFTALMGYQFANQLMFTEHKSPFGVEETAARIQANIQSLKKNGWVLSGLRNPARAVAASGRNVLPVLLVEACSTNYSGPLLKEDQTKNLSILMPCTITVYKKEDGKTYISTMNSGLIGKFFGPKVGEIMGKVAEDQKIMVTFDPKKPAPPLIKIRPGGGGAGGADQGGC